MITKKTFQLISVITAVLSLASFNIAYAAPTALTGSFIRIPGKDINFLNKQINVDTGAFITAGSNQTIGSYIYSFAGSIGIASTSPTQALSVGNYFSVSTSTGSTTAGNLVPVDSGQSLGTAANPWKEAYISSTTIYIGNIRLQDVGGAFTITNKTATTSPVEVNLGATSLVNLLSQPSSLPDGGSWKLDSNLSYVASGTLANLFYIDKTGKIGVGTSTPDQALTVSGNLSLTGAFYDSLSSAGAGNNFLQTTGTGAKWMATSTLGFPVTGNGLAGQIAFYNTNGSSPIGTSTVFISNGNVGIGTTNPGFPLDIRNTIDNTAALFRVDDGSSTGLWSGFRIDRGASNQWFIGMAPSTADLVFRRLGSTNDMIISATGDVGVGTSTPFGKLSASSTSIYPTLAIEQKSAGASAIFLGGNVGIGTTSPTVMLDIAGELKIGSSTLPCNASTQGTLSYSFTLKKVQFCDATIWKSSDE